MYSSLGVGQDLAPW